MGVTRELAKFIVNLKYKDLSKEVIQQSKKCILDFLGVALAGSNSCRGLKIGDFIGELETANKESVVIGKDFRSSIIAAAFANSSIAHGLEMDDGHVLAHSHPGVVIIPAILAVGEKLEKNGKEIITSLVVGYETVIRIGDAITPSALYERGFYIPSLVGTFGATAGVGKLFGLSEEEMVNALAISSMTPLSSAVTFKKGYILKDLYVGCSSALGIISATLAKRGFVGPDDILEADNGFCGNVSNNYKLEKITSKLGKQWKIMEIYFKKYASCSLTQTTIEATLDIVKNHKFKVEEIDKIQVNTHKFACDLKEKSPKNIASAKISIPFCVALAILYRRVSLEEFNEQSLVNKKVRELASKVEMSLDQNLNEIHERYEDKRPSRVTIELKDGRLFTSQQEIAKGWPENPLSEKELIGKFKVLASTSLPNYKVEKIITEIKKLDELNDIRKIMNTIA